MFSLRALDFNIISFGIVINRERNVYYIVLHDATVDISNY